MPLMLLLGAKENAMRKQGDDEPEVTTIETVWSNIIVTAPQFIVSFKSIQNFVMHNQPLLFIKPFSVFFFLAVVIGVNVVQFYPWFNFYFPFFYAHYHTPTISKNKEKSKGPESQLVNAKDYTVLRRQCTLILKG